jgi:multidrug efflux pump subunit AcrA (membrane-fusion protein)
MRRSQRTLLAAAVLAVAVSACGSKGAAPASQGPPPLAVDVSQATRQDIGTYLSLDGQIAPLQESTLSTPQSGNVVAVYVNEGQHVVRGQLLAKLDDATLRAQLAQQQGMVQQQTALLSSSNLQAPVTAAGASNTIASAQQQLQTARNSVQTAHAAYQSARSTYEADRQLVAQGYLARTAFDQAQSAYVQSQQQLGSAREAERQAVVGLRSAQSQGTNAVPIQAQTIAANRGQLAAAQAQVKLLQTQIAQTSIIAPFNGVVTQRLLDPGAFSSPNQPVVRVSQIDAVYVNVNVPDSDLAYVRRGTSVTFTTSSLGNRTYTASVMDVNATPTQGTLSYRARLRVPNPSDALRGGMLVSVNVRKEFRHGVIVVPRTAVYQTENGANLFTVTAMAGPPGGPAGPAKGGKAPAQQGPPVKLMQAKVVPVRVGLQTDTLAEVSGPGIGPGTTVITTRPDALKDQSIVAIGGPTAGGNRTGAQ